MAAPAIASCPTTVSDTPTTGDATAVGTSDGLGTVYYPATVNDGDIAYLWLGINTGTTTVLAPTTMGTWAVMGTAVVSDRATDDHSGLMYWRRCDGSEGGGSIEVDWHGNGSASNQQFGMIFTVSGAVASGTPHEGFTATDSGASSNATSDTTTISGDERLAIRCFGAANDWAAEATGPSGWTRAADLVSTVLDDSTFSLDYRTANASDSPLAATSRTVGSTQYGKVVFSFAVIPASSGSSIAPVAAFHRMMANG
jgi:hypothetical protein